MSGRLVGEGAERRCMADSGGGGGAQSEPCASHGLRRPLCT
jgi:hypothetical protein